MANRNPRGILYLLATLIAAALILYVLFHNGAFSHGPVAP